jgi:hypothetical protein
VYAFFQLDSNMSIDVTFALSKRYSEFEVVFGIPDRLGQPDPIELPVKGASSLVVHLVFTDAWTAAFGGAKGTICPIRSQPSKEHGLAARGNFRTGTQFSVEDQCFSRNISTIFNGS